MAAAAGSTGEIDRRVDDGKSDKPLNKRAQVTD
jgi:hypothetical protein